MTKIFITGSADGLGLLSAQALAKRGHQVYLHARNASRASDARAACPEASDVLIGDLTSMEETKALAAELNQRGPWDTIIHNAGVMRVSADAKGKEGIPVLFAVNTLAPYILTCLTDPPPKRYVFLSSSMHQGGDASLRDVERCGYSDSKLHNVMLANWFAGRLAAKGTACNSMDPGWVPTKMGGSGATDDIGAAVDTYVLLAEGKGEAEGKTGKYWRSSKVKSCKAAGESEAQQDKLIAMLHKISGVEPLE